MTARVVLFLCLAAFPLPFPIQRALAAEPDDRSLWPTWRAFTVESCPGYRLRGGDDAGAGCRPRGLGLAALDETTGDEISPNQPVPPAEATKPRWLLAAAL